MQSITQALLFLQDLKLGHYIKVPPRAMFLGECVCWGLYTQRAVADWSRKRNLSRRSL